MTMKQTKTQGPGLTLNHNRCLLPGASQARPAGKRFSWHMIGVRAAILSCGFWAANCGEPQSTSAAVQLDIPHIDTGHLGHPDTRQGGATNLLGEPAGDYLASAWIRLDTGSPPSTIAMMLKTTCAGTDTYTTVGSTSATDGAWSVILGALTIPSCAPTEVTLYLEGAATNFSYLMEDVTLRGP